jgi:hypothetical protein
MFMQMGMTNDQLGNWMVNILKPPDSVKRVLHIPLRSDGSEYTIEDCSIDQKAALSVVLNAMRNYCERKNETHKILRLTICGVAGSGKSTWINTLVTTVRKMFGRDDVITVFGPTGSAAFNAGGVTMHRAFWIPFTVKSEELGATADLFLRQTFAHQLVLIGDERGMIEAKNLGVAELNMVKCAHNGTKLHLPWGGIPIVVLLGDDYQIPSVGYGAIYSAPRMLITTDKATTPRAEISARKHGFAEFRLMGKNVMYLEGEKRVNEDQEQFRRILRGLRSEHKNDELSEEDIQRLLELDINHPSFSDEERKKIEAEALYIYACKEPRDRMNARKLKEFNTPNNPVARIKSVTVTLAGKTVVNQSHYNADRTPRSIRLCKSAKVCLNGYNPDPRKGLYHGAMGIVKDIVFKEGHSPNFGDMPLYVLVEFGQYCGPPMIASMPKTVAIVPVKQPCNRNNGFCCSRTYIPLYVAFGKTAHTFQGSTVGPVPVGRPPNSIQKIIIDPGNRQFEGNNIGLMYTCAGQGTSIGSPNDKCSSSIYFCGDNFCRERITNLVRQANGSIYRKAKLRIDWVAYLKSNEYTMCPKEKDYTNIFEWASQTRYTYDMLLNILSIKSE